MRTNAMIFGVLYFLSSSTMLLFNKLAISYIPAPGLITLIQYSFSIFCLGLLHVFGGITLKQLSIAKTIQFIPVPALFACAVFANNKILQYSNIETFIVIRNTTPLFVSTLEFILLGKSFPNMRSFASFFFIISGALYYAQVEEGIDLRSYFWGAFYLGALCIESVFVKHVFNSIDMSVWERMLYTNAISTLLQPFFIFGTREQLSYGEGLEITFDGACFLALSCVGGFCISFAGTGFRNEVSATTFTFIGVVNKLITLSVNFVMWQHHASPKGIMALLVCLCGSMIYQPAQVRVAGSPSDKVWHMMNLICCRGCSALQLTRDVSLVEKEASMKDPENPEEQSFIPNGEK